MSAEHSTFGKYFLTEKIATGGMAEIYLAKLLGPGGFEKFLVIKKIHPELSGERQFVEMFVAEAKTLVSLTHGNIVPIYELGMVDSTYFIAMEYIDGPTLEQLLQALRRNEARLSPAMAAYICAELLKGLDYAHRKGEGVIHRDLSPRNVMLSREGEVKLVDFGIAVAQVDHDSVQASTGDPAGSFPYMSPEQVRSAALDPRSDLFAAGILLWEMLTGKRLFTRETDQQTLNAVTTSDIPSPSMYNPSASGVLDVLCARALERQVDARYSSAGEFLIAVNRFLYSQAETVTPQDISRFIAKHCPPTTAEFERPRSIPGVPAQPRSGTVPMERPNKPRHGTVPMERARGKVRAETVQSFATHVNLKHAFTHSGPGASDENALEQAKTAIRLSSSPKPEASPPPAEPAELNAATKDSDKNAKNRMLLILPGLLAVAAAIAYGAFATQDTATISLPLDAGRALDASLPAHKDAMLPDARSIAVDASPPRVDAKATKPRKRGDARAKPAMGSIRVGANPWADVYLDGKSIGRAPGRFEVSAGAHRLELRYREQKKRLNISVRPSQLTSVGVIDFTQAP